MFIFILYIFNLPIIQYGVKLTFKLFNGSEFQANNMPIIILIHIV